MVRGGRSFQVGRTFRVVLSAENFYWERKDVVKIRTSPSPTVCRRDTPEEEDRCAGKRTGERNVTTVLFPRLFPYSGPISEFTVSSFG